MVNGFAIMDAHPSFDVYPLIFSVMIALKEPNISTSGSIHSINLLDGIANQHCYFLHLKRLVWGPDLAELPDTTCLIVNLLATCQKIGMPIEIFNLTDWTLGRVLSHQLQSTESKLS